MTGRKEKDGLVTNFIASISRNIARFIDITKPPLQLGMAEVILGLVTFDNIENPIPLRIAGLAVLLHGTTSIYPDLT